MKNKFLFLLFATVCAQSICAQTINRLRITDNLKVGEEYNMSMMLVNWFGLPQGNSFVDNGVYSGDSLISETSTYTDSLGYTHMKYKQYFNGVLVEGTTVQVHLKDGYIVYANGEYYRCRNIVTQPNVGIDVAVTSARNYIAAMWHGSLADSAIVVKDVPEVVICHSKQDATDTTLYLCYRMHVMPMNGFVYVNAYNGTLEGYVSATNFSSSIGSAYTRYSGIQPITTFDVNDFLCFGHEYWLYDESRRIHTRNLRNKYYYDYHNTITEFKDEDDNVWTTIEHQSNKDDGALDAHWGLEQTYDYFLYNHGWRSLDNHGCDINAFVHAKILEGFNASLYPVFTTNNAIYDASDNHLEFGDGSSERDILTSLDIVAHEFAHGIFHHKVNSFYIDTAETNETNAINEGLSDIWGACVENWATTGKQTWLIGEDTYFGSGYMRNMANPKAKNHPNTYKGQYWDNPRPERHKNAGVLNYWFYLLAHGGSGINDNGLQYNVSGIGMEKAARIVFRAETTYMDCHTNYRDASEYTIRAARELYSGQEIASTIEAWRAVGLLPDYYTRDNYRDDGSEPLHYVSDGYQDSPDIWLRRNADNGTSHQKARHNSTNYVYVNVHNRGLSQTTISWPQWFPQWLQKTDSIELYVKKASLSIDSWPSGWTKIGSAAIPGITSGGIQTVRIDGHFPSVENNYPHNHPYITLGNNVDYAMLTRIVSSKDVISYPEVNNTLLNVINNNNISYKNVVVSSAMFFDDIFEQIAILDIDNAEGPRYRTNIHLTSPHNNDGTQLFKEAEIRLVFERQLLELWRNFGAEFVGLKPIDDTTFLVTSPNAAINGATIPENYYGYMRMQTNFLTHEYTDKFSYEYHVSEFDTQDESVMGSATIMVYKNPRDVLFDAKTGGDLRVKKNTNALLSAESINEDAVYNWYNANGEFVGSGDTLSVNVTETSKYKLEVIAKADGYKDYDSIFVIATYGSIESIAPNPANMQTIVTYDLSEEVMSATIVIANATGQVLYSAPLDVTQTAHTVNLQAIPTGQYTVRIESQGSPLDSKTLIVY